jgi:protein O-mannosyl-transferase
MTAPPPAQRPFLDRKFLLLWICGIALATAVAYFPAMGAGWIWDDNHHVTENIQLRTLHGLGELWLRPGAVPQYYPLTHTTFWIEYHLWGVNPLGYHVDNILLHIANAIMVGLILWRLGVPGYWLAAGVFALHPVQVESVAWVTERKNVLSGLLYLSSLWVALDVWEIAPSSRSAPGLPWRKYLLCLLLFVLALLSKSVTATLPAIILLFIWWKRGRVTWRQAASLIPFFVFGLAMGSLTAWMEVHVVGAVGPEWDWTFPQRILIAGRAIGFYLDKLGWPYPLIFIYPRPPVDDSDLTQWASPVAVIALLAALFALRRRIGLEPLVAALFFVITLIPALGFVNIYPMRYTFVADHYQYLACIGPIALLAAVVVERQLLILPLLAILGFLTWQQAQVYTDAQTLWSDVVKKDIRSILGHTDLGFVLSDRGDKAKARVELLSALDLNPNFVDARVGLGSVAESEGDYMEAMDDYRAARSAAPDNPMPPWRIALLDRHTNNLAEARVEFAEAARNLPDPSPAYEQLGEIELGEGRLQQAVDQFKLALDHNPDLVDAHVNLAAAYLGLPSMMVAAQAECEAALAIDPYNLTACNNMGITLAMQGQKDRAAEFFNRALKINPDFKSARDNLAKLK